MQPGGQMISEGQLAALAPFLCCFYALLCSCCLATMGLFIFWVIAYTDGDAADNVDDATNCTDMPFIFFWYFVIAGITFGLGCLAGVGRGAATDPENPGVIAGLLGCLSSLAPMANLVFIIMGISDYFKIDSDCETIIKEVGSDNFWVAIESFAIFQTTVLSLVGFCCVLSCCGMVVGGAKG